MPEGPGRRTLRVIDFGEVTPLRSQTLWHAVAAGVSGGSAPTLSFVRTADPYVSIGFHRSLDEVDTARCAAAGWPVLRRRVGGGPVFVDGDQLCFQVSVPASALPASRAAATRWLLEPALAAFRAAGLDAGLDPAPEVVVGDRKVCGHGAAQIGSAVVLVGNLIERFDHAAAASILKTPDGTEAEETLGLMRRYVAFDGPAPVVDAARFARAAVEAYASALGLEAEAGDLSPAERDELARLDRRFQDPDWLAGAAGASGPAGSTGASGPAGASGAAGPLGWRAKIKSRVWRGFVERDGRRLGVSVVDGRVISARVEGFGADGEIAAALEGMAVPPAGGSGVSAAAGGVAGGGLASAGEAVAGGPVSAAAGGGEAVAALGELVLAGRFD